MAVEHFPIEEGHILMFARAIGDSNPVFTDRVKAVDTEVGGIIAPPTFVQASAQFDPDYFLRPKDGQPWFGSGSTPSGLTRPAADVPAAASKSSGGGSRGGGIGSGLHAEQRYEYHAPLKAGDVLSAETKPGKTWEKEGRRGGKLVFGEAVIEYRNQDGELVVTATSVGVRTERVPDQGGS
jgi:acyl dehydratase